VPLLPVEPLPDDPDPVALRVYPGGQSAVALLLDVPEPPVLLLDEEPALPVVLPEPDGTQPAGMLPPSERLPLPAVPESMLEPDEPEPVVAPVEPEPEVPPEEPEPLLCASAVPAASMAANVKASNLVIVTLSCTCELRHNGGPNGPFHTSRA
jgi:hypothetical protein